MRLAGVPEELEGYLGTGNSASVASGRISYVFGLEGPAVTVDTACSSSLVAVHLAAQALRSGECDMALAAGVNVMASPATFVEFSRQRGLSPDGRCKAFAAAADGTGWSEGAGVVVLERLADARRRGHRVLALVRGSAVNQDGASNGLTAPNGPSQQRVIQAALAAAGLAPAEVDAVEAHGTGTRLGDPIEAQALLATYGRDRPGDRPLWLGSVKSNIGHCPAAAGMAGVIKMVMAMRHGLLPQTLHVDEPTPHVDWSAGQVRLLTEAVPWPAAGRPRRAGVSAFGISGTNAHLILEEPPAPPQQAPAEGTAPPDRAEEEPLPYLLSARSPQALAAQAARLADHLDRHPGLPGPAVARSLATTRTHHPHRAAVIAATRGELRDGLDALAGSRPWPGLVRGQAAPGKTALLFTGQGSQRPGMGRQLYHAHPVFADALDDACAHLDPHLDHPLAPVMFADPGTPQAALLHRTEYAQPALFAHQVALCRLLAHWGIRPDILIGHSIGELTAAHLAGLWTLDGAAALVTARGHLMQSLPPGGAMIAIQAPEDEVTPLLDGHHDSAAIAAVNGPDSTVISGDDATVTRIAGTLAARGRRTRRLRVSHAFHSPLMDPILDQLTHAASALSPAAPALPLISNLTGQLADPADLSDPAYWARHARHPVRFADGIHALAAHGTATYLEIGPDATLTPLAETACPTGTTPAPHFIPAQRRNHPETRALTTATATLHTHGTPLNWAAYHTTTDITPLPTYPFQHQHYWLDGTTHTDKTSQDALDDGFWDAVEQQDLAFLAERVHVSPDMPFSAALPALAQWRRQSRESSAVDSLSYRVTWKALGDTAASPTPSTWLVAVPAGLADDSYARDCLRGLADGGMRVVPVELAHVTRETAASRMREVLADQPPVDGVLSMLALDESPDPAYPSVCAGLDGTLTLIQALGDADVAAPLWCITRGAVSAGPSDTVSAPQQAQVWGLCQTMAFEYPDRWGGLADLPEAVNHQACARLIGALAATNSGEQLAIRPTGTFARRLARWRLGPSTGWAPSGTVLITGGTGALGAHVARWLARNGAKRIVLASRRGADAPGADALRTELTTLGAQVAFSARDMADREAAARLLAEIAHDGPPLTAVVNAVGMLDDGVLDALSTARLERVLRAKADSARNLHELTADSGLSAFILFSSIAGAFGAAGQANYAAANAYLDALAEHRRVLGLPATSIAWGAWAGSGMASSTAAQQRLRGGGVATIDPTLAVTAMAIAVTADPACLVVADIDWERFARETPSGPDPFFTDLPEVSRATVPIKTADSADAPPSGPSLRERLTCAPAAHRGRVVLDLVLANTSEVLGHASVAEINPMQGFLELGLDSLGAVKLRNRLNAATSLQLPTTTVFDYPTPQALAQHLLSELLPSGSATNGHVTADYAHDAEGSSIDELNVDDLLRLAQENSGREGSTGV